jgi:catechol 2,3-dioxygenase-like lactoylglutathione lyase family enzyme
MLEKSHAFSGFSVNDLSAAKKFYGEILGLATEETMGMLSLKLVGGTTIFIYQKDDHIPAMFTILNFPVQNIDQAVAELRHKGVSFERYEEMQQDNQDIARGLSQNRGPDIAWFKDPAGNILSVLQDS